MTAPHALCIDSAGYGASLQFPYTYLAIQDAEPAQHGLSRSVDEADEY